MNTEIVNRRRVLDLLNDPWPEANHKVNSEQFLKAIEKASKAAVFDYED